ncbi:phosphatase PAP2 family protein [Alkalinema sp. FACHB-956]|uniref:phosphatase PAP2 family protein n=1 Tax=Alkalinema sp. FACHB-956 TaxID=2692768 RepID=UPI001681CDB6|nr:phosphatase PAP2 family protein [Alkalinema sp. FACHB-956]MBD2330069.1 phosphatase PAP2 family protein [Alkalinema sp. FACHB-956]
MLLKAWMIQQLQNCWLHIVLFAQTRVSLKRVSFSGLPLPRKLMLWLRYGVYVPLQCFILLAIGTQFYPDKFAWEKEFLWQVHRMANPRLDAWVQFLTDLGVYTGVVPASLLVGGWLLARRHWRSLGYWGLTLVGNIAINRTAKFLFHRERPQLWPNAHFHYDFSFPSGHAMSSMTFILALIILLLGSRWAVWVMLSGAAFVLMIAWTRIYLGVHYPSDIFAGWMLSTAWAIGTSLLVLPHKLLGDYFGTVTGSESTGSDSIESNLTCSD